MISIFTSSKLQTILFRFCCLYHRQNRNNIQDKLIYFIFFSSSLDNHTNTFFFKPAFIKDDKSPPPSVFEYLIIAFPLCMSVSSPLKCRFRHKPREFKFQGKFREERAFTRFENIAIIYKTKLRVFQFWEINQYNKRRNRVK